MSSDDQMAVMNMVKDGEMTLDQAIAKVKAKTKARETTIAKKAYENIVLGMFSRKKEDKEEKKKSKDDKKKSDAPAAGAAAAAGAAEEDGLGGRRARNKAMRKNRGRLLLTLTVQKASVFSVLVLGVKEGRDLAATRKDDSADPYVKMYIVPDSSKETKRKTQVRKNTLNPMFSENFSWEIRAGTDLESHRLHISVWDNKTLGRNEFMGGMSFSLAEIFDDEVPNSGWFKLLDKQKAELQYVPFRAPRGAVPPPPSGGKAAASPSPAPAAATPKKEDKSKSLAKQVSKMALGPVTADSFNFTKVLGQGSFGKVLLAEKKGGEDVFAIKVLQKEAVIEDDDVGCTMTERRVLALASGCPFLTNLYATFQTPDRLFFVMEFVNGGDLMFHIQKEKKFPLHVVQYYTAEICLGLMFLHTNGVIYRDLKLDNVMLDGDGHIKIADFGMCKEKMWGASTTTTFCGTPGYLAPEIIQELPYGFGVDWWSLGVLVYEMLIGDSPFSGDDEEELFESIQNKVVEFPPGTDANASSLILGFLTREAPKRLGVGKTGDANIKAHPMFSSLSWEKIEKREIPPPYKPVVKGKKEVNNFDSEFTSEDPKLSPPDAESVAEIDQNLFKGFSFVNQQWGQAGAGAAAPAEAAVNELQAFSWYRPDLARDECVKALKGTPVGTFFVRESASQPGCYAITMQRDGSAWHGLITPSTTADGNTLYKLFVKQKFNSLPELVDYYCEHPVTTDSQGKKLKLAKP